MDGKKMLPNPVGKIVEKYSGQPIFAKMIGQQAENDRYVLIEVEAIFSKSNTAVFSKLINEISVCGFELFSMKEIGVSVDMLIFKKVEK